MDRNDYLNPITLKLQCRHAIKQLEADNKSIDIIKGDIDAFLSSNAVKGDAIVAAKKHMSDYIVVLNAQERANDCDIHDFRTLSGRVGNEILDGEKIITLYEKKKMSMQRKLELADYFRQADCFDSDIISFGYRQIVSWYENSAETDRRICNECEKKMQRFDEIVNKTNGLFEDSIYMRDTVNAAVAGLMFSFVRGKYVSNSNAPWRKDLKLASYGITRPSGISDTEWNRYKEYAHKKINEMEKKGWSEDSIGAYVNYINKNATGKNAVEELRQYNNDADIVGSEVFKEMWYAWKPKGEADARQKLETLMNIVGMKELEGNPEQTKELLAHFDSDLAPHDPFWADLADTVQKGYPEGLREENELVKKIHQFRYIIDAQQVKYIRTTYDWVGGTDEDKLAAYARDLNNNGLGKDWTLEADRLHQKTKTVNGEKVYPDGSSGPNIKITFNEKFHSEFILDSNGNFLYVLDDTEDEDIRKNSIINGASFNYADENNKTHTKLDVNYGSNDPEFRKKANPEIEKPNGKTEKEYIAPQNVGRYKAENPTKDRQEEFKEKVNG